MAAKRKAPEPQVGSRIDIGRTIFSFDSLYLIK